MMRKLKLKSMYFKLSNLIVKQLNYTMFGPYVINCRRRLDQVYDICVACKKIVRQALNGNARNSSQEQQVRPPSNSVERPGRPSTPVPMPLNHRPRRTPENPNQNQNMSQSEDNNDLTELTQLHIGSNKPRSQAGSIFGGSTNGNSISFVDWNMKQQRSTLGNYSPSPPPLSTISGYFGDKQASVLPQNSWQQNVPQPMYPYSMSNLHQASSPFMNYPSIPDTYQYNYKSSSVASVFGGGRKPILSPSILAGGGGSLLSSQEQQRFQQRSPVGFRHYNHMCYCPQNGVSAFRSYNLVYGGRNMALSPAELNSSPPLYNYMPQEKYPHNNYSNSSSQSSGFVSVTRDDYNSSSQRTSSSPSRFSTTPNSGLDDDDQMCSSQNSRFSNVNRGGGERRYLPNPKIFQRQHVTRSTSRKLPNTNNKKKRMSSNSQDGLFFSDDDEDDKESKGSPAAVNGKLHRHRPSSVPNPTTTSPIQKSGNVMKRIGGCLGTALSPRRLCQLFLRTFVFINVLVVFCIFFVGEWPEPISSVVNMASEFYVQCFGYILPLLLHFEYFLNVVLSYLVPDGSDDLVTLDDEALERMLFN